jgi:hypothetical protein
MEVNESFGQALWKSVSVCMILLWELPHSLQLGPWEVHRTPANNKPRLADWVRLSQSQRTLLPGSRYKYMRVLAPISQSVGWSRWRSIFSYFARATHQRKKNDSEQLTLNGQPDSHYRSSAPRHYTSAAYWIGKSGPRHQRSVGTRH